MERVHRHRAGKVRFYDDSIPRSYTASSERRRHLMSDLDHGRVVQTVDLGPEQLQIIEESGQRTRVLFRGVWLRDGSGRLTESWRSDRHGDLQAERGVCAD